MMTISFRFAARACLWMLLLAPMALGEGLAFETERDGTLRLQNDWISFRVSNRPGSDQGIRSWTFKPTGAEMVDVLYGQTDYLRGHLLGECWDPVELKDVRGGVPACGSLYAAETQGVAKDGSGLVVRQVTRGAYTLERTLILRRDLLTVEARYRLRNLSIAPLGMGLRFHSTASPGARGKYQRRDDSIFLDTEAGLLELDQSLSGTAYGKRYTDDKFLTAARAQEPPRGWVNCPAVKTPILRQNWAAWVNRNYGDGMAFLIAPQNFLGYYNAPGATLEPMLKAFSLAKGETWETTAYLGSFTGARERKVVGATPLYVVTSALSLEKEVLAGEIIPLFAGKLHLLDSRGKKVFEANAKPDATLQVRGTVGAGWTIVALDRTGSVIGTVDDAGAVTLSEPVVEQTVTPRPVFAEDVYVGPGVEKMLAQMIADRNFIIQCDWSSKDVEKDAVRDLAGLLRLTPVWTCVPQKALIIGNPSNSGTVRDAGLLRGSVSADWPGKGRGAILAYENIELTQQPALLVAGSDAAGTLRAVQFLRERYLTNLPERSGYSFVPVNTDLKIYPYTTVQPSGESIRVCAARGEYESAQVAISALEDLKDVDVTVAPLIHAESGKEISRRYDTAFRKRNGPIWIRWVNYYPAKPEDGWAGYPDPLLERPERFLSAGRTQGVWLTFIVPEDAQPGLYRSAVTCKANGQEKTVPIELTVWDFTLPRDGLRGEPYINMGNFPPDDKRDLTDWHIRTLVEDLVEHGMRVIHLPIGDLIRWHFSPQGQYKHLACDWMEVSEDGDVAMDASRFDHLVEFITAFAKPYDVSFMVYDMSVQGGVDGGFATFKRTFPKRFNDMPKREGAQPNWDAYYSMELLTLFRKHLEAKGLMKRVVYKVADEPPTFDWWWNKQAVVAREVGLPIMTAFNHMDWTEAETGLGTVAIWQPLYQLHNPELFQKAKAVGAKVSWYNCGPPPRTAVQTGASELRGYLWQAAKADLDVICWWGIQCWVGHEKVWNNRYEHWNSVIYPPHPDKPAWMKPGKGWVDGVIDSIRWEHIRDGMEDAWYVNLLRRQIAEARKRGLDAAADKAQGTLDTIWRETFPTLNDYAPEFPRMLECRARLAEAIVEIQKVLKPEKK